jgi:centromere protein C
VALQNLTREVKGADFLYAKTLTLPFFHSGMVDLPSGGEKRVKNTRKNHMVFWVFYGRVMVDVAGVKFSIGKGGMWQVPRGNFYSIANTYSKPARIFFAQGCCMTEGIEEAYVEERGLSQG